MIIYTSIQLKDISTQSTTHRASLCKTSTIAEAIFEGAFITLLCLFLRLWY